MSPFFFLLLHLAVLAAALVGGVFLAFSDFIMRSLARTGGAGGVEAMQIINREVFRWVFMALFLGMVPLSLAIAGFAASSLEGQARAFALLGSLAYLAGCFGVTAALNVPMNTALGALDPAGRDAASYWRHTYLPRWTFWNTVRCGACILAAAAFLGALASAGPGPSAAV